MAHMLPKQSSQLELMEKNNPAQTKTAANKHKTSPLDTTFWVYEYVFQYYHQF